MNRIIALTLILTFMSLALAACTGNPAAEESGWSNADTQLPLSEQSIEENEEYDGPNLLQGVLVIQPEDLVRYSYYDNPELEYRQVDKAIFPVDTVTYTVGIYTSNYPQEDSALALRLARALEAFRVGYAPEELGELPSGQYFSLHLTFDNWRPYLTFFDSGEIYVNYNNGNGETPDTYLWRAADSGQYGALKAVLEEIGNDLDARPLDYQVESWASPSHFKPESQALRIAFQNIGKDTVRAETFTIYQASGSEWRQLAVVPADGLVIEPRSHIVHGIDLTAISEAQAEGNYLVAFTLQATGETLPVEILYTIDRDAYEMSNPPLPAMTPENEEYSSRYVSMWGFYNPFQVDFNEENYLQEFHTYHLFYQSASIEGTIEEYRNSYHGVIPAEIVEGTIMRHFLVSAEQIRANTPKMEGEDFNEGEYYDPGTNSYVFMGGYGGGTRSAVVTDSRRDGNLLTLVIDWYDVEDSYESSQELTIRLGQSENDFVYVAGRLLAGR